MDENQLRVAVLDYIISNDLGINKAAAEIKICKATLTRWLYKNGAVKRYILCKIEHWMAKNDLKVSSKSI